MPFIDYSSTPALNTTIGDAIYIGPNMARNDVRDALQQLAADGRALRDEMIALGGGGELPQFIQSGVGSVVRSLQDKLREQVSAFDYFSSAQRTDVSSYTGALDVTVPLQAALDAAWGSNRDLFLPAGLYTVTGLIMPGGQATRNRAFKVYGQGGGELFARAFDNGTIIQSSTNAPILRAVQDLANAGNGNQEVAYIRFEQTNAAATAAVLDFETLYAQSEIHHCGVYQGGNGDGIRIRHANTVDVHHNYVLNNEWTGTPTPNSGIGIHVTCTNDNGLLTLRKNTSRGFLTGYKIGSDTGGEDGYLYGWRMEQCEASVNVNGVLLTSRARDGVIDTCYFEGGAGGYGIKNEGNGNKISNNHMSAGYATCIDDSPTTNRGSLITGNVLALGNANTAAANPVGVKVDGGSGAKTVFANRIVVDHVSFGAVVNAKGIVLSGAAPLLTVNGNEFEQADWSGASGSQKIDDNTTGRGVAGLQQVEDGGAMFDVLSRGGVSFYEQELTSADVSTGVLTLPSRGTAFSLGTSGPVSINSIAAGHDVAGSFIILQFNNSQPTLVNSATVLLRGGRSFTGSLNCIVLYCYKFIDTNYWVEICRSSENSADKGVAVPNAAAAPTQAEFNALLTSLRNANVIAT